MKILDISTLRRLVPCPVAAVIGLDGLASLATLPSLSGSAARLDTQAGVFVVRTLRVNGTVEAAATRAAHRLGLGPELVYADEASGLLVTRWIHGTAMTAETFRSTIGAVAAAGSVLRRLHDSDVDLGTPVELSAIKDHYETRLRKAGRLPRTPDAVRTGLQALEQALSVSTVSPVPSHGDPVPANWISGPAGLQLIDWTFAGVHDPAWDLAYLSLEGEFTPALEAELLAGYGKGGVDADRMHVFELPVAWISALWGLAQVGRPDPPDLVEFALARYVLAERLAADPGFLVRVKHLC